MDTKISYEKLAELSMFSSMEKEALIALASQARLVKLSEGEVLFHQGDAAITIYLIEQGAIKIVREYEDGEKLTLEIIEEHHLVGELSTISSKPRVASGIAVGDTTLIAVDSEVFFKYIGDYPAMSVEVMVQLTRRLRQLNLQIREIAANNAPARVASLVLFLAEEHGELKTGLITTNFRMQRIARAAGVDLNWLIDLFRKWSEEGHIGLDGRRFLLHDPEALEEIAGW